MKRYLYTLAFFCLLFTMSLSAQPTFSLQMIEDVSQSNSALIQAKISGNTITGGVSACAFGLSDFIFNMSVGVTWPAGTVTSIAPVASVTCGVEGEGYNFSNAPGLIGIDVNGGTNTGTRIDKNPVGGVTSHPFSWADDTWVTICTVAYVLPSPADGDEPQALPAGFRLIELSDTWAGGPSFLVSNYSIGGAPNSNIFNGTFDIFNEPLPLTLTKFEANKNGDRSALLSWQTVSEIGTSHFVVQRSETGTDWIEIGSVDAAGQSSEVRDYSFMDRNVYDGKRPAARFMYRLVMIDLDNKFSYSNIDIVKFSSADTKGTAVFVYPNPSTHGVTVEFDIYTDGPTPANMEVFNALGQLLYSRKLSADTEIEYIDYTTANIPGGTFFLRISDQQGVVIAEEKLVVAR